ncbi:MAG TPA: DUF4179 domain-containing protein [Ktedonobacteraceae bacterium]|nr:DUF4179 domain-containing protein [Ktedonobacteraceae bacterium]
MNTRERYSDLFDEHIDPQLEQCLENLEATYTSATPPDKLNWQQFQMQSAKPTPRAKESWRSIVAPRYVGIGRRRVSLPLGLALSILVVLVCGGFVYAAGGLPQALQALFSADPGTKTLLTQQQITEINQTFVADGYKVTLESGYADGSNVILGLSEDLPHMPTASYKIKSNKSIDENFKTYEYVSISDLPHLTTSQGVDLPVLNARSLLSKKGNSEGLVYTFNAASIQGNPTQITLHLELFAKCNGIIDHQCARTVKFNFMLPFHAGRVLFPHQVVRLNGKTLTLEKVVIAPTETRFYIRGFSLEDANLPPWLKKTSPPKTYTSKYFDIKVSNGKKTYNVCTVSYNTCSYHDSLSYGAMDRLYKANQLFVFKDKVGNFTVETPLFGGEINEPIYMGDDQSVIGLSMPQSFSHEHGDWTITVKQQVAQLHLSHGRDGTVYSPAPNSAYVLDKSATSWTFKVHLP